MLSLEGSTLSNRGQRPRYISELEVLPARQYLETRAFDMQGTAFQAGHRVDDPVPRAMPGVTKILASS